MNSKNKNIENNLENGDLLVDSHKILNRCKNYFSQLLNFYCASDVNQKYIQLNHSCLVPVIWRLKLLLQM
jgi:hypothetical protein